MSTLSRIKAGLTSPWALAFSIFGAGYGIYNIIDITQSGEKYELDGDLEGKTYIVTGATSGLGKLTTEELAKRRARVIMACRDRNKCISVRRDIVLATKNKQIYCRRLDLEDFDSVERFVSKLSTGAQSIDSIDGLVNNAAVMEKDRSVNKLGIEKTLATNHMGTFLLTGLLIDKFLKQKNKVRIVFVNTNLIQKNCKVNFDDLNNEVEKFDGFKVYKESKLAEALFVKELAERLKKTNISVFMADPGRCKTKLASNYEGERFFLSRWMLKPLSFLMGERRPEKGIRPILYAIGDSNLENQSGLFLDRERKEQAWPEDCNDATLRKKLWITSEKWTRFYDHLKNLNEENNANKK